MRRLALISSSAVLMTAAALAAPAHAVTISSTFDTTAEGWTVGDNGSTSTPFSGGGPTAPTHLNSGGNPDGYINTPDVYSSNAFYAPSAYLGDQSSFYGGTFKFSLQELVAADINPGTAVVMYSGGSSIAFAAPAPGTTWTDYSIGLTEAGWTTYTGGQIVGGAPVSLATFQSFLSNITALTILADWHNGSDDVGLDSVSFNSGVSTVPIPATLPLLVSALGGLGFIGWRRRKLDAA